MGYYGNIINQIISNYNTQNNQQNNNPINNPLQQIFLIYNQSLNPSNYYQEPNNNDDSLNNEDANNNEEVINNENANNNEEVINNEDVNNNEEPPNNPNQFTFDNNGYSVRFTTVPVRTPILLNILQTIMNSYNNLEDVVVSLDESELEKMKVSTLESDKDYNCCICMNKMIKDEVVMELPCKHDFHNDCIKEHLINYSNKCPICRLESGKAKYNV